VSATWAAVAWAVAAPLAVLALAPLLDGAGRQVRARLETRAGPPLLQGYVDLAKLAGKREVSSGVGRLAAFMPALALASAGAAAALVPVAGIQPLGAAGDAIVLLYLLGLSSVALVLAGSATGSPFGFLGASREMLVLLFVEPVVACALFVAAVKAGTFRLDALVAWQAAHGPDVSGVLAATGVLLALLAYMGRVPFDLSEAEQELMGGAMVEYGGRRLALLRWTMFVRWLVVAWLVAEVFLPTRLPWVLGLPVTALKVAVLFGLAATASVLVARLRIDHVRAYLVQVGLLMVFALVFALIGA
jgi:formate hydrogenlyase subunit 4